MATLRYLGHSAFYLQGEGLRALLDPFLSGNPLASEGPEARAELDYIFLTHGHGDHLGDTVSIAGRSGATVVCTNELSVYLAGLGVKVEGMHVGGRASFSFGRVKLTPALHGSAVFEGGRQVFSGVPCGFLIELEGKKLYHAGDTGLSMEMTLLGEEGVDVALLPIGGYYTMDAADAARALGLIRPKRAVPMHYNTFPLIEAEAELFRRAGAGSGAQVVILKPGEELEL